MLYDRLRAILGVDVAELGVLCCDAYLVVGTCDAVVKTVVCGIILDSSMSIIMKQRLSGVDAFSI